MAPKASDNQDSSLGTLKALVLSTSSLISQLENDLQSVALGKTPTNAAPDPPDATPVDALALARDSATLVKAHTTKLSLLIINEPFTPSAIVKVLRELAAGPVPAIASAVQLCAADTYTSIARQDLAWKSYQVLKELRAFVDLIPLDGKALSGARKSGTSGDKGSILATGVVWAACDDVILLKQLGIGGLLAKKIEEYRDTLQDVLEELKEWSEEIDDEDDDADELNENDDGDDGAGTELSAQQMLDDLMASQRIPRDDPDRIRERLDSCLKRLRLTTLLYAAIIKRRIKALPPLPSKEATSVVERLDRALPILKRLPHQFGEVACAFYDLDPTDIDTAMDTCISGAVSAAEMLKVPWEADRDAFTEWAEKFQTSIKKPD
ncbi:hypothetical protein F5Y17DRAFT_456946 [Xylariaceae sp. FL0594]|nr:hypothetical protein F5Y17DRAFT_456946 [Xylariaceae sp. FL0594]